MKVLVTGGGGFLGRAIVSRLIARGDRVRSYSRNVYPELAMLGVEQRAGDLDDITSVIAAVEGCDAVIHVAAKAGIWGARSDYERTNVLGTQNIVTACVLHGVTRLVYTSSPSVVFDGRDAEGIDESKPYPARHLTHYSASKAVAEQLVRHANSATLATVSLRPHLIWGPGDPHLLPRLYAKARAGQLRRVGSGRNRVDTTYIDNAALAHILALDRLDVGSRIAGKVYFIAQGEPRPLGELFDQFLAAAELAPIKRSVSPRLAYVAGYCLETLYTMASWPDEPRMTRFLARQLATAHWFDLSAAERDLGYTAQVSFQEGLAHLADSLRTANAR